LQLTHYRPNALGDIQTEVAVHDGLTEFGAEVIRRCNRRGIVVDVAHGTYDLVKRAAAVTTKPLIVSHTALSSAPPSFSRLISPDHARAVAGTGGVIGVWPAAGGTFTDRRAMVNGMARLVDLVGVDHVGFGSDMLGLVGATLFAGYAELPQLAETMLAAGFGAEETGKILGGNYRRVFEATIA
jgi:membrane dipeptidase